MLERTLDWCVLPGFLANSLFENIKGLDAELGRIGRALRLMWLKPQDADSRKDDIITAIHTVSIAIGMLCAKVGVIASFFYNPQ